MSRILAIDHGTVRIGLAISDPLRIFAKPLKVIPNQGFRAVSTQILDLIKDQEVGMVLLGLPLAIDGSKTPKTLEVEKFGEKLKRLLEVELIFWDERYSSSEAEAELRKLGYSWQESRSLRDAMAAAMILKNYLEHNA
ncbi:MAG TPA: Holliday junction resolvase RuvX [Candidatus Cloacimonadota bacterium]|nr:Holliday junction resolvase RuvX [Candidatus Cloacimonadota bacterium]HPN41785.1 Holliday junction resolvase RuvX [Candidatus Cloacimonadota bacterium]